MVLNPDYRRSLAQKGYFRQCQTGYRDDMVQTRRKRPSTFSADRFSREQRRALKMLAGTPRGLTENFLLAHGFSVEMLSSLARAKLATVVTEPMMTERGVTLVVERIRITDAGRMVLEGFAAVAKALG
jgi:hypothetical protein